VEIFIKVKKTPKAQKEREERVSLLFALKILTVF